jgi:hypothetical protein
MGMAKHRGGMKTAKSFTPEALRTQRGFTQRTEE